jgi:hypothetical protein
MVGVAQLAARELGHPRLLLAQQFEVARAFFRIELRLVARWRTGIFGRAFSFEYPSERSHTD